MNSSSAPHQPDLFDDPTSVPGSPPAPRITSAPRAPLTPHELAARIQACTRVPFRLHINANRSSMVTVKGSQPVVLSVHRMFLQATPAVVRALAQYVQNPTRASRRVVGDFIDEHEFQIDCAPRSKASLRSRGRHYDLNALARAVNEEYFGGRLQFSISYSRQPSIRSHARRHIVFGTYDHVARLVRIHPALDSDRIPEFFVKFVIFHELLHADTPYDRTPDGKRVVHTAEFRERERAHPDFARAAAFEQEFFRSATL